MNINLKSYFLMSKYVLPSMLNAGEGVIVNMGGVVGGGGLPSCFFVTVGVKTCPSPLRQHLF